MKIDGIIYKDKKDEFVIQEPYAWSKVRKKIRTSAQKNKIYWICKELFPHAQTMDSIKHHIEKQYKILLIDADKRADEDFKKDNPHDYDIWRFCLKRGKKIAIENNNSK